MITPSNSVPSLMIERTPTTDLLNFASVMIHPSEIREALLLLKNKMNQEELEKDKQLNELKRKENIIFETNINKDTNDNNNYNESIKNYFEEEKIEGDNKYYTKYVFYHE